MAPPAFPLLLVVPAFAIDLTVHLLGRKSGWLRDTLLALVVAIAFMIVFVPTQWWFSKFMLSSAADNWFFAAGDWAPYSSRPGPWVMEYWGLDPESRRFDPVTWKQLFRAACYAFISARIGLAFGAWMSRVKR